MRPQRIESQPKGLPQGDERPTKAHPFRSAVQCPRRYAGHGTKTVDGSYTQADLRPSIVKTKYPDTSFLVLRRVEDCFAINQSCGNLARRAISYFTVFGKDPGKNLVQLRIE